MQVDLPVDLLEGERPRGEVVVEDEEGDGVDRFEGVYPKLGRLVCKATI